MLGRTVTTTSLTRFEDHSSADLERFSLADLRTGDYVELRAYEEAGVLVATLVERDDPEDGETEVEGVATDVAPPNLTVGGIAVTTDTATEFKNRDGVITAAEFFSLAPGREVKIRGTLVGAVVLAERAELED
jgi:nitrous oxidase accessory protein NosD